MNENSTFVKIGDKNFLIDNITILDTGEVNYSIYSSKGKITDEDRKNIENFVRALLKKDN